MPSASLIVPWLYLAVPAFAVATAIRQARRGRDWAPIRTLLACIGGGIAGGSLLVAVYAIALHGRVEPAQVAIACYWAVAIIYVLRGFNRVLTWALARAVPIGPDGLPCCPAAELAAIVVRAVVLLGVGVPYVVAMVLIFRPHISHPGTPTTLIGAAYQDVTFAASDGVQLRGWWIPAARSPRTDDAHPAADWGGRTVILCHGFGADKAAELRLVRELVPNGYNVLAFDFRAHGQSAGQLTTFGDLERRDVLGAVRWVRAQHADQSHKLFGLGEGLGAAALISAAADPSAEGQALDALAVFAPYDRLTALLQGVADDHFAPAAGWLVSHLALPLAGGQLGTRLAAYQPARDVQSLWPRPLLVIAGEEDRPAHVARSRALYDEAMQPKYGFWIEKGSRDAIMFSHDKAALGVRVFFEQSRSIL